METIKSLLKEREEYLLQLKREKENALLDAPEGKLRVSSHAGKTQYYVREDPKDFNGTYIKDRDIRLAIGLAQKDYDRKVLSAVKAELGAIEKYFAADPIDHAEEIYGKLHEGRRRLVAPVSETEEQIVEQWCSAKYRGKGFGNDTSEFYTAKGERVRSKSEIIIADALMREEIPYKYECPLYIKGVGMVYPDFTVLNVDLRKEMYWEHMGMLDDDTYLEKALKKLMSYEQNGIFPGEDLILTCETKNMPLSPKQIQLMIEHFLK